MIKIEYNTIEIKVTTQLVSKLYELPLRMVIKNQVSGRLVWECDLGDNSWASFPNSELNDTYIYDKKDLICLKTWDTNDDGDILYRSLNLYCENLLRYNIKPHGLAIGTHDGEFGEWVPSVLEHKTSATLVEASTPQFEKIKTNFRTLANVILINKLVTTDGKPVEFFEGGRGYTNSVVERVIKSWETEEISSSIKPSISINELIKSTPNGYIDWLHLDVEGYDPQLIMAVEDVLLPNFIIFENNNLKNDEKTNIFTYLETKGYTLFHEPVSTLALK
jgi:hypothetical protein